MLPQSPQSFSMNKFSNSDSLPSNIILGSLIDLASIDIVGFSISNILCDISSYERFIHAVKLTESPS